MSDDEYGNVARGKLKLKNDSEIKKKKKKKKDKDKEREKIELADGSSVDFGSSSQQNNSQGRPLTKSEQSFKQMQEKMQTKRIMEKAAMTHKMKVEKFNQHLDSLTEHFDIPKVSWTK